MRDIISVRQSAPGVFVFTCEGKCGEPEEIRLLKTPEEKDTVKNGVPVEFGRCKTSAGEFEARIPDLDHRPYFLVREKDREYITAERTLPVGGMNNFRDMGGYQTLDNRTVRWGMLYRSGHFHSTTDEGLAYLRRLGIHTVIDYRSRDEIEKYPNREIASDIRTFLLDPEAHTAELSAQFTSSKENEDINLVNKIIEQKNRGALTGRYDMVMEQYRNFVEKDQCKRAFTHMLKAAAEPGAAAVVQHCRGGKDRTGFGAMLLLGVLGVEKETIVEDYMVTGDNRISRNQAKMDIYRKYTDDPEVLAYLYSLIETRREFIEASYDRIVETCGSMEDYVVTVLGVDKETILSLREKYLA